MAKKFTQHTGIAVPMDLANVDTDAIIPKQFLQMVTRTGFGRNLFFDWRYSDAEGTVDNPEFIMNQPAFRGASIMLTRENFGCGSSREHAPWALSQYGFRAVVAPSFADIFFNNCYKNGLLPVVLTESQIDHLFNEVKAFPGFHLVIDLEKQVIGTSNGATNYPFDIDAFRKYCMLNGFDDIGLTLQKADKIRAFEERHLASQPWLANTI